MKFICRHWYNVGLGVAICSLIGLIISWGSSSVLERLAIMSFIAILIHQFEEYGCPGGEPAIMNMVLQPSDMPDRYPLNQFSAMLTNVLVTYIMYVLPIFFPNVIWLGIGPILMGILQFTVHGIATNIKMKSIYNPGLGAVVFLHFPIGFYYIYYITVNNLATGAEWIKGIVYLLFVMAAIINGLTYRVFPNRNTKYIFEETEMKRFHVKEKLQRIGKK